MYLSCSTLCFAKHSLSEAMRIIRELRFSKVDLTISENVNHIKPMEILNDVNRTAGLLKSFDLGFSAFHLDLAEFDFGKSQEILRAVSRLARQVMVPMISIHAAKIGSDLTAEVERLSRLLRITNSEGVILSIVAHSQMVTADPQGAEALCRMVPGLGLTLDPSHYLLPPHSTTEYDFLYPYVRHVRLRDSRGEQLQVRVGKGEYEYSKMIAHLVRFGYDRALSVDIRDIPETDYLIEPEVRKMKYFLESMI